MSQEEVSEVRKEVLIILAEGFEEVEALTPIDVLRRAGVKVVICGLHDCIVKGSRRVGVEADLLLSDYHGNPDMLVLPGGLFGAKHLKASDEVAGWVDRMNAHGKWVAAICASPAVVLADAGIVENKKVTCYPGYEKEFSESTTYVDQPVVVDGNLITSQGPGTAFEFSKILLKILSDEETAENILGKMLFTSLVS